MNICLISREYPTDDHLGGIGTYTEKTARAMAGLGHDVHVITETYAGKPSGIEHGVHVIRLNEPKVRPRLVVRSRQVAQAIARLPRPPDIVQACEWQAEGFWYAMRGGRRSKLVTRLATPGFLVDQFNYSARFTKPSRPIDVARARAVEWVERLQTARSDAIISPTMALADIVCERWRIPRERAAIIRTGVDFAGRYAFEAHPLPESLQNKQYMLYFGRLEERKGVHILAEALNGVLDAFPHMHMAFVGLDMGHNGQPMRAFIEERNPRHKDRLLFYPRLPHKNLYPVLQHAEVAVLPSLWENLANTCLEALDMGVPVIATRGCGFGEVIDDGRNGLLVPPGDALALEQAMASILRDGARLIEMRAEAKASAASFSLETVTRHLLQFYEQLIAVPRPARREAAVSPSDVEMRFKL